MAIVNREYYNIYEQLEYNFLYKKDLNSIHILLNLYDLDKNIKNIHPLYTSLDKLMEDFSSIIGYSKDYLTIFRTLACIIHEDINRLELYVCLEGYKSGYFNKKLANGLEKLTIEDISTERLYNKNQLYHFCEMGKEISEAKLSLFKQLDISEELLKLKDMVIQYSKKIIEPGIDRAKEYIEASSGKKIEPEIDLIKDSLGQLIFKNIKDIYKELYWYGLNDRVLKRYR